MVGQHVARQNFDVMRITDLPREVSAGSPRAGVYRSWATPQRASVSRSTCVGLRRVPAMAPAAQPLTKLVANDVPVPYQA
jgi:hypothetical protein